MYLKKRYTKINEKYDLKNSESNDKILYKYLQLGVILNQYFEYQLRYSNKGTI